MIHLVADRPTATLKVYDSLGNLWQTLAAQGDAWGNHDGDGGPPPYGTNCWCPPGHFRLGVPEFFSPPIVSEGFGQIPVLDLDADTLAQLSNAGKAVVSGSSANIGGLVAEIGQLAKYNRSAIMVHGGGSNAPDPFTDYQQLCRTEGCPRMYNVDWKSLAHWLEPQYGGNVVIFTIIGNPLTLSC